MSVKMDDSQTIFARAESMNVYANALQQHSKKAHREKVVNLIKKHFGNREDITIELQNGLQLHVGPHRIICNYNTRSVNLIIKGDNSNKYIDLDGVPKLQAIDFFLYILGRKDHNNGARNPLKGARNLLKRFHQGSPEHLDKLLPQKLLEKARWEEQEEKFNDLIRNINSRPDPAAGDGAGARAAAAAIAGAPSNERGRAAAAAARDDAKSNHGRLLDAPVVSAAPGDGVPLQPAPASARAPEHAPAEAVLGPAAEGAGAALPPVEEA